MTRSRVKTPTIIQMEAAECGAASLAIVLAYYEKWVPLEQLRLECGVSRDGSDALKILQTAEKHGLKGKAFKRDVDELEEIEGPVILFWEFRHFLVLEGISQEKFFINDPSLGHYTLDRKEFKRKYTGIVITFTKTPQFQTGGKPPQFLHSVMQRLKVDPGSLFFLFFTGILLVIPGLGLPVLVRIFIDDFLINPHFSWEGNFFLALFVAIFLSGSLTAMRQICLKRLNVRLSVVFSTRFLWHLLRLPIAFYTQRFSGEIAFRMSFHDKIAQTLTGSLAPAFVDLCLTVFYALCLFLYNTGIGLLGVIILLSNLSFMLWIQRSRKDAYARMQQEFGRSVGVSIGTIQQIDTIKAAGIETSVFANLAGYLVKNINAFQEIGKKDAYLTTLPIFFQALGSAVVLSYGGWLVIHGDLTLGMLMALFVLMQSFLAPISRFVNFGQLIQNMSIDIARLDDVTKNPEDLLYHCRRKGPSKKPKLVGHVQLKEITFGYIPGDKPLIDRLSFDLTPGKRIALVGASGCGKSTLAKLCCSLYSPWSGHILYDHLPIAEVEPFVLQNSLSVVDQEIMIFEGTVWENLTLWDLTITEEMVFKATKDAEIHEEILHRHPLGYQAPVIEGGKNLSGGQKQRLEIARALLRNPSILIMDEATSSLDSEVEKKISDNIRRRGCSCIMIAHRLSTIQDCDEIIVLDHGKIVDRGTHEKLKVNDGIYRNLVLHEKGHLE